MVGNMLEIRPEITRGLQGGAVEKAPPEHKYACD
jgi:hypothetical protein